MPLNLRAFGIQDPNKKDKQQGLDLSAFQSTPIDNSASPAAGSSGATKLNLSAFGIKQDQTQSETAPMAQLPAQAPVGAIAPGQPAPPLVPPGVVQKGADVVQQVTGAVTGAVQSLLKPEERSKLAGIVANFVKTIPNRIVENKVKDVQTAKDYIQNQIVGNIQQGVQDIQKPGVIDKATGVAQVVGGAISATPEGVAFNTATGVFVGSDKAIKEGGNLAAFDPAIRGAITHSSSIAKDVLNIQDPTLAFVVDLAITRNPKSILKDPTGLKGITKILKGGGKVDTSNFRMDKLDQGALEEAQTMITHPEQYLDTSTKIGPGTKQKALQAVRDDAVVTLYKLAQHYLPDEEMKKFGITDRYIPSDQIINYDVNWNKLATRTYELSKQNKLGMINDSGPFQIQNMGMGLTDSKRTAQGLAKTQPEVSIPKGNASDVLPSSTLKERYLLASSESKSSQTSASVKTVAQPELLAQDVKPSLDTKVAGESGMMRSAPSATKILGQESPPSPGTSRVITGSSERIKAFTQGVRAGKQYGKNEVASFQKDLTGLLKELPISERGKLTYLAGLRKANTAQKVSKEAEKINAAITKVEEARQLSVDLGTRRSKVAFIKKIGEFDSGVIRDIKKQMNVTKPLKEMNEQELNQLNASLLGRLKFKENRGFKVKDTTTPSVDIVPSESIYTANRQVIAENNKFGARFSRGVKDAIKQPKETLDNLFGAVSTRLKNIDPALKRQMRTFEYKVGQAKQNDRISVEPFVRRIKDKHIDPGDYADLDLALKNGDTAKTNTLLSKYGLEKDFAKVRQSLDDIYKRADEVGFDIGYKKNYTPRVIKDPTGFLEYLQKGNDWSIIDEAIKAKEQTLARYLTTEEKANLINTMVRGYKGGGITLSETGAMKVRSIEVVDHNLNQFYGDSVDSLLKYIDKTNDAIEARRFFGKVKNAEHTKIDDSIGKYVLDLLSSGKIKASQEKELRDILTARFNPQGTHGMWGTFKNLAYIDTMGSPISAISQIADLAFSIYKGGPIETVKALGRALVGKSKITKEDLGIERIATEFEDSSQAAKILDRVFKVVGLNKLDSLGKDVLINASIGRYRNLAKNPNQDFVDKLTAVFGSKEEDITRVIDDLKAGNITEDVKLLAFNELLDVQPVALSEMPVQYLKGGNGRVFYMLKSYTIKQFDVYRNEVWHEMVKNPVKGTRNLLYLTGTLMLAGATADEIKDLVLGRQTSLEDRTADNLLKLAGFSKFTIYKAREEGAGTAISQTILPPMKLLDSITKDLTPKADGTAKGLSDLETPASIPVGGKLYYWWFGKGAQKTAKAQETAAKKQSKKTSSLKDKYLKSKSSTKGKSLRDKYL